MKTAIYYNPTGNPEVWEEGKQPKGHFTSEEWRAAHPLPKNELPLEENSLSKKKANATVNKYMPITGGSFTGSIFEPAGIVSGVELDVSKATVFKATIKEDTAFTFTGVSEGDAATFSLILTNGGSATVTWPNNVQWGSNGAPALSAKGTDVLTFLTGNGGIIWYGTLSVNGAPAESDDTYRRISTGDKASS